MLIMSIKKVVNWVLTILLAVSMLGASYIKLTGTEFEKTAFVAWGYPVWFMYLTGIMELIGLILLVIPKTRFYGAVLILVVMIGAILTHLTHNEAGMVVPAFVLAIIAGVLVWLNRPLTVTVKS
jgi:putative oxidoreductase